MSTRTLRFHSTLAQYERVAVGHVGFLAFLLASNQYPVLEDKEGGGGGAEVFSLTSLVGDRVPEGVESCCAAPKSNNSLKAGSVVGGGKGAAAPERALRTAQTAGPFVGTEAFLCPFLRLAQQSDIVSLLPILSELKSR